MSIKSKLTSIALFILIGFFVIHIERAITENYELRQLNKEKLRLEIQDLKLVIELNEIELQKEY